MTTLSELISEKVMGEIGRYSEAFNSAEPFKHVVIDDFFSDVIVEQMIEQFPVPNTDEMFNEFGAPSKKHKVSDVKGIGGIYEQIDDVISSDEFANLMGELTKIDGLLYDPSYYGGGTHNNLAGQGMNPHVDFNLLNIDSIGEVHRRINAILYLNDGWLEEWGGCIELHKNPWTPDKNVKKKVIPIKNRLVLFETNEKSWHGFERVSDKVPNGTTRKSFAIYMYTKDRPKEEIAPEHGTFYVPQFPSEMTTVGRTLTASDVTAFKQARTQSLGLLRHAYEKQNALSAENAKRSAIIAEYKRNQVVRSVGFIQQVGGARGFYPDFLMSENCRLYFECRKDVSNLVIAIDSLDFISDQKLEIVIDEIAVDEVSMSKGENTIDIPVEFSDGQKFCIEFRFSVAMSPKEAERSHDERRLSARFRSIQAAG